MSVRIGMFIFLIFIFVSSFFVNEGFSQTSEKSVDGAAKITKTPPPSSSSAEESLLTTKYAEKRLAPKTNLEHYIENDLILVGKIVSVLEIADIKQTNYQVEVEKYIKNPQNLDKISVFGSGLKNSTSQSSIDKTFDEGSRVLLFLNKVEDRYLISPYSVYAALFDPDEDFILPPLKLYKSGILPNEIVCRGDLVLVLKASNNTPACVKAEHVDRLTTSGWLERILAV